MRVASTQFHATMNSALQNANARLAHVMQQMSTGERVLVPSDDSIAAVRLARLSREEARLAQYRDNIGALGARLRTSEVMLDSLQQDLMAVRDLLVWAADGGNTPDDLGAMAGSLGALHDSLLFLANTRNAEGRYLFSGTATDQPTVDIDALGNYSFLGNADTQKVAVADQVTVDANTDLQAMAPMLQQLNALAALLAGPGTTAAAAQPSVSAMLVSLDQVLAGVTGKIGQLGGRQNLLTTLDDNHASVSLSNQQAALDIGQLDYGEASVHLNGYTLAVQATQKAYAKVSGLSLFNAL